MLFAESATETPAVIPLLDEDTKPSQNSGLSEDIQKELRKPLNLTGVESPTEMADAGEFSVVEAMVQMFLALFVVVAMIIAAALIYRRWGSVLTRHASGNQHMELIETMPLGVKRAVSLVRVGDQVLVLGQGEHDIRFLYSMDAHKILPGHDDMNDGREIDDAGFGTEQDEDMRTAASDGDSNATQSVGAFKSKLETMLRSKS